MNPILFALAGGLLLGTPSEPAALQPATAVTLRSVEDAFTYADWHNRELPEYRLRQVQAESNYKGLRFYWLPKLNAAASLTRNGELAVTPLPGELFGQPGQTVQAELGQRYSYQAGLSITKSILDRESHFAARAAKTAAEGALASTEAFKQQLREQIAINYYAVIATQSLLNSQRSAEVDAAELLRLLETRRKEGVVADSAVNRGRINYNSVRLDRNRYRDIIEQSETNLRILLGLPAGASIRFTERSPGPALPEAETLGIDRSLRVDELFVTQTEYQAREQQATYLPDLILDGYYGAQQLRNDFGVSFDGEDWNAIQYATLTLSFPLFTGFSQRNQVKASEAAHEQARQALERRREESAAFDRSLVARRSLYLEQTRTTHESYTLAQTNSAAALRNYEQGVTGLEDYLNARDEERNAEAAYLNALLEYYQLISTYLSREA